jgi:hypothetical protein
MSQHLFLWCDVESRSECETRPVDIYNRMCIVRIKWVIRTIARAYGAGRQREG